MQRAFGIVTIPSGTKRNRGSRARIQLKPQDPRLRLERHYLAAVSALLSRALRRFAAFPWTIPRLAALSIAEISARICSGLGVCAERTIFCIVRRPVTTLRLRSDRFTVWRARLAADFVFAIVIENVWTCMLASASRLSTLKVSDVAALARLSAQGLSATSVCSIRASPFVVGQRVFHPFAFARRRG